MLGSYSPAALAQVAVAALSGTLVIRATVGAAPIFMLDAPGMEVHQWEYPVFVILGILAAGVGISTMKAATWCETVLRRLPTPEWLRPAIGGVILSAIAALFPQVLGSGHGAIQALFISTADVSKRGAAARRQAGRRRHFDWGRLSWRSVQCLPVSRLFVRRHDCAGGRTVLPWLAPQQTVFILVGMGAVAASIVGGPITMVLLVLEVTGDFRVALGVLAGVVMSATITRYAFGYSFATWRFHQRGKTIRGAFDVGWVADLTVGRMQRDGAKVVGEGDAAAAIARHGAAGEPQPGVCHRRRRTVRRGQSMLRSFTIPTSTMRPSGWWRAILRGDRHIYLTPEMDIRAALARFEDVEAEALPVLAGPEDRRVVGYLSEAYALRQYAQEMERHHSAELGQRDLFNIGRPSKRWERGRPARPASPAFRRRCGAGRPRSQP